MSTACRRPSDALLFETAFRSFFSVVATHILGGDLDTDLCLGHASLPRRAWWLARYFNPVNLAWRYYSMIAYRLSSGALGPARLAIINFEPFPYHPPLPYVIAELSVDDPMVRRLEISGLFSSQGILSVVAAYQGILAIQFTISTSGFGFLPNITKALAILGLFRVTVSHWIASKVYVEPFAYPYMHPNQESLNPVNPHPNSNPNPNLDNPYPNPNLDNPNPNPNPNPDLKPNPNPKLNPNSNPYPNPNPNPNPNCNCNPNCNPNLNLDNPDPNLDLYPNPYHSPYANPNHNPSRNLDLYPNPYHNPNSNPNRNPNRNVDNPNPNPNHNHNHNHDPNPNPNPKRNCNPNYNPNPNSNLENHKSNPNLNSNPNHNPNLENHNNYPNLNLENCNPNANANANPNPNPNSNLNSCVRRVNKVFAGAWLLTMAGLLVLSTRSYIPAKSSTVPTHPIDRSIEFLYNYIAASALLFHSVFISYGIRGLANRNLLFDHWFYQAQTALFMAIFLVTLVIGIVDFVQRDFYRFCA